VTPQSWESPIQLPTGFAKGEEAVTEVFMPGILTGLNQLCKFLLTAVRVFGVTRIELILHIEQILCGAFPNLKVTFL